MSGENPNVVEIVRAVIGTSRKFTVPGEGPY